MFIGVKTGSYGRNGNTTPAIILAMDTMGERQRRREFRSRPARPEDRPYVDGGFAAGWDGMGSVCGGGGGGDWWGAVGGDYSH